jgi:hypothetical protein
VLAKKGDVGGETGPHRDVTGTTAAGEKTDDDDERKREMAACGAHCRPRL